MPIVASGVSVTAPPGPAPGVAAYTVTLTAAGQRIEVKRGDQVPSLGYVFPAGIDLTGASVRLLMANGVTGPAVVVSAATRTVRYDWAVSDLTDKGTFDAEFEALLADGRLATGPPNGYLRVRITDDLG